MQPSNTYLERFPSRPGPPLARWMTPLQTLQGKNKENKKLMAENLARHRAQRQAANRRGCQGEENAINKIPQTDTGPEFRSRDPASTPLSFQV